MQQLNTLHPDIQKRIYQSFYNFIYKDIYYLLKDHASTEDLIQEVFFRVTSTMHRHGVTNPVAWIKKVARNQTLDYLRRNNKERYRVELRGLSTNEHHFDDIDILGIEDEIELSTTYKLLHQSIAELKPDYRILITLHYIEEMSYKEIAATLGMSEPAVGQKLLRARRKLLQIFQLK